MQLTETVTVINKSGKIISNGKHIVNIFKEAKAAYQDKKAAIKADRAAAAAEGSGIRRAQTYGPASSQAPVDERHYIIPSQYDHVYEVPERSHFISHPQEYPYEHYLEDDDDQQGRGRSVIDHHHQQYAPSSHAGSRRSHGTHKSRRSQSARHGAPSRPALTETNLRTLTEVSATTPSQVPQAYRSAYAETAPRDMAISRPALVHPQTAPCVTRAASDPALDSKQQNKKKKDIDMNLAYGNIPPDLATRTDLGPVTKAEEDTQREKEARDLMQRIDGLMDEAECVQHSATAIIAHLQEKPEAAAAVALLLAELSTLLKTLSPGFLGVVKSGFPAVFALLASPQFLVGVGVAVGVTVVCFGGWKIVKQIKASKAAALEKQESAQAFEQQQYYPAEAFQAGPAGPGSYDDALVLDEELSTIETWRRGITPYGDDDEVVDLESVDLELITPEAARSVRGDAKSIRTVRTHRSSKSHRSHRSRRHEEQGEDQDEGLEIASRKSSRAARSSRSVDAHSEAGSERSHRTSRSKTTVRTGMKTIEDGSRQEENTLEAVLRPKDSKKSNMLKTLFKKKKERDDAISVMA